MLSSDFNSIVIQYNPVYSDTSSVTINNELFKKIEVLFGSVPNPEQPGLPSTPERLINVGVPGEFGNTIQVLSSSYYEINGKLLPIPSMKREGGQNQIYFEVNPDYALHSSDDELVMFGEYGLIRDIKNQSLRIKPVHFDALKNKIRLYDQITFRINFSASQEITEPIVDELSKDAVLNFSVARNWSAKPLRTEKITVNSVLANGRWFRFEAPVEGMYRITYAMLASYGIEASSVDPRTIKIYNNGGKMLPESVMLDVSTDLVENAITVIGEEDGVFNQNDYILFYGRGTSFWEYDTLLDKTVRRHNVYSKENYYWITSGGNQGKRIQNQPSLTGTADVIQTTTQAYAFLEEDKVNFVQSGRFYFGDEFNQTTKSRTYMNTLTGRVDGTPINYRFRFINNHTTSQLLTIDESGTSIFNSSIQGTSSINDWNTYLTGVPHENQIVYNNSLVDNRSVLKFTFNANSLLSRGYLDFFEINFERDLASHSAPIIFFAKDTTGSVHYKLSGFSNSNIHVFDITNYSEIKLITNPLVWSGGDFEFINQENSGEGRKYLALLSDYFLTPTSGTEISNSNLHGISAGAQFIIITPTVFLNAANRLKDYRENNSPNKFSTLVVELDDIYNEFSGGMLDIAGIRNFLKYAFQNWQIRPEYVLLLGDGDYDYRNIEGANNNFVPTYQIFYETNWYRNLHHIYSYASDDFYALINGNDPQVDLATGRINAQTLTDANNVIDKIIEYESSEDRTNWNNLISLISDDGYTSTTYEGTLHTAPSEYLSSFVIPKYFDLNKIYMASYPDELTSSGRRKPAVNKKIIETINQGTLILNYIGHGSPDLWAHEVVFDKNVTVPQLQNKNFFFLTAATCDFGYYDIPNFQSATEMLVLKPKAGCIGAVTSSRLVFAGENNELMYRLFQDLLNSDRDSLHRIIPVGKSFFLTKQVRVATNDRKYHLFGDPTLRLRVPQYSGNIDSINGIAPTTDIQIKALSRGTIEGEVIKPDSSLWSDFNGEGVMTIYDSERRIRLASISFDVNIPGGVIFRGRISIQNGKFNSDFIVPKDISYENKNGKVVVYFYNEDTDGIIFTDNVIIGGTDSTVNNDGEGPQITIHFDDESNSNANLITPNSSLIVKLNDETGLNTTGTGIGHKLEGILNDDESNPIDFTNYFTGDLDAGGRSGEINYRFSGLENGEYKLLVKAWDVFNNFASENAYFSVVTSDDLVVRDIYNYPNPFAGNTTFTFQHNLNSAIDVKIKIYSIAGRLIHQIESQNIADRFVAIDWDGRDMDGDLIANGTYLYKIVITTSDGQYKRDVLGKLAVIR
ncbi:MAG: type IX secretion system sortase PorU [Ignavibacteriales bacterium]|nr:MAG: type IX secretion system sortase PorU [Ignavibacteriales bacterium]